MCPAAALLSFTLLAVASAPLIAFSLQQVGTGQQRDAPLMAAVDVRRRLQHAFPRLYRPRDQMAMDDQLLYRQTNCYTGNRWDGSQNQLPDYTVTCAHSALCPDTCACACNCKNIGSRLYLTLLNTTSGKALTLKFVTRSGQKEFTFDVDVSNLPCGLNGALYFVGLDGPYNNFAGAKYGTGYCADVERALTFIGLGGANYFSTMEADGGVSEMDIWEANSIALATATHSALAISRRWISGRPTLSPSDGKCHRWTPKQALVIPVPAATTWTADRYTPAHCDPDGCDFNAAVPAAAIPMAVLFYGPAWVHYASTVPSVAWFSSSIGMVLVPARSSQWDDHALPMLWLDSTASAIHVLQRACTTASTSPPETTTTTTTPDVSYSTTTTGEGSCGGIGWTGPTTCASPYTCQKLNDYYSQCL
uniref:cellulose 1,4-beta-cellobiosidase (non-reducing end) n=1 Tax=Alternaria japonica TaxID=119919 RepID=T1WHM8_9PLEO|nr:cellobiohydrolase I [Alternaria japonica]